MGSNNLLFYMLEQFFSGHNPKTIPVQLLRFYDHYVAGSLYERVRLEHHPLNPYLHQQRGLKEK